MRPPVIVRPVIERRRAGAPPAPALLRITRSSTVWRMIVSRDPAPAIVTASSRSRSPSSELGVFDGPRGSRQLVRASRNDDVIEAGVAVRGHGRRAHRALAVVRGAQPVDLDRVEQVLLGVDGERRRIGRRGERQRRRDRETCQSPSQHDSDYTPQTRPLQVAQPRPTRVATLSRCARAVPIICAEARARFEQEVDVVLPGEADAAEGLDRVVRDRGRGVRRARLRHRRGDRQQVGIGVGGPCRGVGERAGLLDLPQHVGEAMRDGLVGADRAAELLALLGVLDRHVERALGDAHALRRERDLADAARARDVARHRIAALGLDAEVGAGGVDEVELLERRVGGLDELRAVAVGEDQDRGAACRAEDRVGVAGHLGRAALLARGDAREPLLLLLVRARGLDHGAGVGVGDERRRRQRVAEFLLEDDQLDRAEPLAAVLLVDRDPGPAELADRVPLSSP